MVPQVQEGSSVSFVFFKKGQKYGCTIRQDKNIIHLYFELFMSLYYKKMSKIFMYCQNTLSLLVSFKLGYFFTHF